MHDTLAAGTVWKSSGVVLEGVLGTVVPAGEHDAAPTGLESIFMETSGSEHTRFTASSRLGSCAASSKGN